MTPREKAIELFRHFWQCENKYGQQSIYRSEAVGCALICVDEIINYHNSLLEAGLKDVHMSLLSPVKQYNDILNPLLKYWEEVKQEIENLS